MPSTPASSTHPRNPCLPNNAASYTPSTPRPPPPPVGDGASTMKKLESAPRQHRPLHSVDAGQDPLSLLVVAGAVPPYITAPASSSASSSVVRADPGMHQAAQALPAHEDQDQTRTQPCVRLDPTEFDLEHEYDGRPPCSSLLLGLISNPPQCNRDGDLLLFPATPTSSPTPLTQLPSPNANTTSSNSTLAFFDKFVNEAKVASESKRRSLLDEILLHQEDPWARNNPHIEGKREGDPGIGVEGDADGDRKGGKNTPATSPGHGESDDVDMATAKTPNPPHHLPSPLSSLRKPRLPLPSPPSPRQSLARRPSTSTNTIAGTSNHINPFGAFTSGSPSSSISPAHSPTLTPSTLAPPLLTESVDMDVDSEAERDKNGRDKNECNGFARGLVDHRRLRSQTPTPASSAPSAYATLSGTLPTRWMSSWLSSASASSLPFQSLPSSTSSGGGSSTSGMGAMSSLESICTATVGSTSSSSSSSSSSSKTRRTRRRTSESFDSSFMSAASASDTSASTASAGAGMAPTIINIDKRTTKKGQVQTQGHADSIITHQSPFSSHTLITPISGAPGFMERRYDWDKGFSSELMKEMKALERVEGRVSREESVKEGWRDGKDGNEVGSGSGSENGNENGSMGVQVGGKGNGSATGMEGKGRRESVVKRIKGKLEKVGVKERRTASSSAAGNGVAIAGGKGRGNEKENEGVKVVGMGEFMEKKSGRVELKGRKEATMPVLEVALADLLRPHLPALDRLSRSWHLVYSLDQHGISLNTLYTRCEAHTQAQTQAQAKLGSTLGVGTGIGRPGMVLVAKDSGDTIFGVWMGEGIRPSKGKGYYGSGECFMWRYAKGELSVFKWTGRNKYVALCEPDYISFGGGDGWYGLYLDETLFDGTSAGCPTFENEPLCSPGMNKAGAVAFECVGLEVWGVGL